jgi:hypothetical protein
MSFAQTTWRYRDGRRYGAPIPSWPCLNFAAELSRWCLIDRLQIFGGMAHLAEHRMTRQNDDRHHQGNSADRYVGCVRAIDSRHRT